jgi:hypothetical protein
VKACKRESDYRPAVELCRYLTGDDTSAERADINIARALRCLPGGDAIVIRGPRTDLLSRDAGSFASSRARYAYPGVQVRIDWAIHQEDASPSLKISGKRLK